MFNADTSHIFLPCWRDGRLLFFTDMKEGYSNRLEYRAAAATELGSTVVKRSFKAQITPEQLALCQETAEEGQALQRFFKFLGGGNLDQLVDDETLKLPACAGETNRLIYICSYLNLLRKYSVDQQIVKNYENLEPGKRFNLESARAIYKILSAHLQPERASAMIDLDIPDEMTLRGNNTSVANLLREAAIIKYDVKDFDRAEQLMLRALKLHNTEDKWRRLADISAGKGDVGKAIEYLTGANNIQPLAPHLVLRLATSLVSENRFEEAEPFLEGIEKNYPKPVENLRKKM